MSKLSKLKFQAPLKVSYSTCMAAAFEASYQKNNNKKKKFFSLHDLFN